jgi:hypothetical protein
MISSYPPARRRQLLSNQLLISTLPEEALHDRSNSRRSSRWFGCV